MNIAVVGSGFVGQATGNGLQKHGNNITFVDVDETKITNLLAEGFEAVLADRYARITTEITMFCVPTPTRGGAINLDYLIAAIEAFAHRLKNHDQYHVAVIRSTVPPGTTRTKVLPIIERISGKTAGEDFGLIMQPEYLREITAKQDFARPWFILIGELDPKAGAVIHKLYRNFDAPIQHCTLEEAEFQKYVHNVYNAVKIAFFNEMRLIAKNENWDADKVFRATAESGEAMWNPIYGIRDFGPFDGSCLPKDTRALLEWAEEKNYELGILRAVITENFRHEELLGKNQTVRINYLENISV